jgi:hypothetical protein
MPPPLDPSLPVEPHATQTSLTTHHTSIRRAGGGARIALVLAACGLVAGVGAVGVSVVRDDPAPARSSNAAAPSSDPPVSASAGPEEDDAAELASPAESAETFELPPNDPSPAGAKPRTFRPRPRPAPAAPKTSGPTITSQPRY